MQCGWALGCVGFWFWLMFTVWIGWLKPEMWKKRPHPQQPGACSSCWPPAWSHTVVWWHHFLFPPRLWRHLRLPLVKSNLNISLHWDELHWWKVSFFQWGMGPHMITAPLLFTNSKLNSIHPATFSLTQHSLTFLLHSWANLCVTELLFTELYYNHRL